MAVAFDAATAAQENGGDGVLSLTHTSTGSNRAVFAGVCARDFAGGPTSTSTTYDGTSMTELWDFQLSTQTQWMNAGYRLAGQNTGAVTVTNTVSDTSPFWQSLGVQSMTGVDQTTPVGTPATASEGGVSTATVTVGSVGADDLPVDNLVGTGGGGTPGADQTQRYTLTITGDGSGVRGSSQPGTAGGVMSWSLSSPQAYGLGAVAFKPVAAAGRILIHPGMRGGMKEMLGGLNG